MSSKWFPWDYFRNSQPFLSRVEIGIHALSCYDPFVEKMVLKSLPTDLWGEGKLRTIVGSELTKDWIEENLLSLNLFSTTDSYLVLLADQIPKKTQTYLLEEDLGEMSGFLILSFVGSSSFYDELGSRKSIPRTKIEAPRFWEGGKLLEFVSDRMNIRLSYPVQNFLVESVPNETADFVNVMKLLALHFGDLSRVSVEQIKEFVIKEKLDKFQLASFLGGKKRHQLFQTLANTDTNFDELRGLFQFFQSHLLKISDTSYIQKKKRPTKYDKEIQAQAQSWTKEELKNEMRYYGGLEIMAKSKSSDLKNEIRLQYFNHYK